MLLVSQLPRVIWETGAQDDDNLRAVERLVSTGLGNRRSPDQRVHNTLDLAATVFHLKRIERRRRQVNPGRPLVGQNRQKKSWPDTRGPKPIEKNPGRIPVGQKPQKKARPGHPGTAIPYQTVYLAPLARTARPVDRARYLSDLTFVAKACPPGSADHKKVQDLCADRFKKLGLNILIFL